MLKTTNTVLPSSEQWAAVIRGARNPLNSWGLSDSTDAYVGEKDLGLLTRLTNAGPDHGKFMRQIPVIVDISAPLYWWKEMDQYKVGTVTNSCSTMHKIHAKEFTLEDFSHEDLFAFDSKLAEPELLPIEVIETLIRALNHYRDAFNETGERRYWRQMIQLLPTSYNQTRTVSLNYSVLKNIYHARKNHKLTEWHELCHWIETLPYAEELIIGD